MAVEIPRSVCVCGPCDGRGRDGLAGRVVRLQVNGTGRGQRASHELRVGAGACAAPSASPRRLVGIELPRTDERPTSPAKQGGILGYYVMSHTRHVRVGLESSRAQSRLNTTWPAHVFTRKRPRDLLDRSGPLRGACCQCSTCVRAWRACGAVGDRRVDARGHLRSVRAP